MAKRCTGYPADEPDANPHAYVMRMRERAAVDGIAEISPDAACCCGGEDEYEAAPSSVEKPRGRHGDHRPLQSGIEHPEQRTGSSVGAPGGLGGGEASAGAAAGDAMGCMTCAV